MPEYQLNFPINAGNPGPLRDIATAAAEIGNKLKLTKGELQYFSASIKEGTDKGQSLIKTLNDISKSSSTAGPGVASLAAQLKGLTKEYQSLEAAKTKAYKSAGTGAGSEMEKEAARVKAATAAVASALKVSAVDFEKFKAVTNEGLAAGKGLGAVLSEIAGAKSFGPGVALLATQIQGISHNYDDLRAKEKAHRLLEEENFAARKVRMKAEADASSQAALKRLEQLGPARPPQRAKDPVVLQLEGLSQNSLLQRLEPQFKSVAASAKLTSGEIATFNALLSTSVKSGLDFEKALIGISKAAAGTRIGALAGDLKGVIQAEREAAALAEKTLRDNFRKGIYGAQIAGGFTGMPLPGGLARHGGNLLNILGSPTALSVGGGVAAVGIAAGAAALLKNEADASRATVNLSRELGVSVSQAREFENVAKLTGVSVGAFTTGERMLSQALEDQTGKGKNAAESLHRLGIGLVDSSGNVRESGTVFNELLQKLAAIPSQTERAREAVNIFGRGAIKDILPLVENFRAATDELAKFGLVVDDSLIGKTSEAAIKFGALGIAYDNLKLKLAAKVEPIVIPIIESITRTVAEPFGKGPTLARSGPRWIQQLREAMGEYAEDPNDFSQKLPLTIGKSMSIAEHRVEHAKEFSPAASAQFDRMLATQGDREEILAAHVSKAKKEYEDELVKAKNFVGPDVSDAAKAKETAEVTKLRVAYEGLNGQLKNLRDNKAQLERNASTLQSFIESMSRKDLDPVSTIYAERDKVISRRGMNAGQIATANNQANIAAELELEKMRSSPQYRFVPKYEGEKRGQESAMEAQALVQGMHPDTTARDIDAGLKRNAESLSRSVKDANSLQDNLRRMDEESAKRQSETATRLQATVATLGLTGPQRITTTGAIELQGAARSRDLQLEALGPAVDKLKPLSDYMAEDFKKMAESARIVAEFKDKEREIAARTVEQIAQERQRAADSHASTFSAGIFAAATHTGEQFGRGLARSIGEMMLTNFSKNYIFQKDGPFDKIQGSVSSSSFLGKITQGTGLFREESPLSAPALKFDSATDKFSDAVNRMPGAAPNSTTSGFGVGVPGISNFGSGTPGSIVSAIKNVFTGTRKYAGPGISGGEIQPIASPNPPMYFGGMSVQNTLANALATLGLKKPSEYSPTTHTPIYDYNAPGSLEAAAYKSGKILRNTASGAMNSPDSRSMIMRHEETHALLEPFIDKLTNDKALEKYVPKIRQGLEEKSPVYKQMGGLPAENVISEGLAYRTGAATVPGLGKDESQAFVLKAMKDLDKTTVQLYNKLSSSSQSPALYFADKAFKERELPYPGPKVMGGGIEPIIKPGNTDTAIEAETQALTLNTAATKDLTEAYKASANQAPVTAGGTGSSSDLTTAIPALNTFGSDIKGLTGSSLSSGFGGLIAGIGAIGSAGTAIAKATGLGIGRGQHGGSSGGGGSDGNGAGITVVGNDGLPIGQANTRLTDTLASLGLPKKGGFGGFIGTAERGIGSFTGLMGNPFGDKGGLPGVNGQPGKDLGHFSAMGVAAAGADVALGAYTAVQQFKKGGARGALGGASAILGTAAALDPEPVSKAILGIAALGTGLIKSILGDPKIQRQKQIEKTLFTNQYLAPESLNVTSSTRGTYADFGRDGNFRTSSLSPYPRVTTPYLDVPFRAVIPGTESSQFGGGGPIVVNNHYNISALDGVSVERVLKNNPTALMESIAHGMTFGHSRATQTIKGAIGQG